MYVHYIFGIPSELIPLFICLESGTFRYKMSIDYLPYLIDQCKNPFPLFFPDYLNTTSKLLQYLQCRYPEHNWSILDQEVVCIMGITKIPIPNGDRLYRLLWDGYHTSSQFYYQQILLPSQRSNVLNGYFNKISIVQIIEEYIKLF